MVYITGDTHRDFSRLENIDFYENDMIIILGDVGINYYLNEDDIKLKDKLNKLGVKLFCIRGNHEERPENINTYKEVTMFKGKVFMEDNYPNLIFAKDGEIYNIEGMSILVMGGAYSVDKDYRIINGLTWFKDEQLTKKEMDNILKKVKGKHFDVVFTHTCPYKYEPKEVLLSCIDQSKVDKTMEHFFDEVEESIDYNKWYCGHYHTEKVIDKLEFMCENIKRFGKYRYMGYEYEIISEYCRQEDINKDGTTCCPKCNSENIVMVKGDGENIIGLDIIGVICKDCKKVYGFNNVKYKKGCIKEL